MLGSQVCHRLLAQLIVQSIEFNYLNSHYSRLSAESCTVCSSACSRQIELPDLSAICRTAGAVHGITDMSINGLLARTRTSSSVLEIRADPLISTFMHSRMTWQEIISNCCIARPKHFQDIDRH